MIWELANDTAFQADRAMLRDARGAELWVVVVKAAFDVHPDGSTSLAKESVEPFHCPVYRGDPARSSLLYGEDFVTGRAGTEILLNGSAYAPEGRPAESVDAGIAVGAWHKVVRVFGERIWERGVTGIRASRPQPFSRMPLVYERAFGGVDPHQDDVAKPSLDMRNPVGRGYARHASWLTGTLLPNVEDPKHLIRLPYDMPEPAGFGAIAPHWTARARYAGTYDAAWEEDRCPVLPADFDPRFLQCAPADQQCAAPLAGGEEVRLVNLTPDGFRAFRLPRYVLGMRTLIGGSSVRHRPLLMTIVFEPDAARVIMVWHSALPCHGRARKLTETAVWIKPTVRALA
jgi:hypothetical protein